MSTSGIKRCRIRYIVATVFCALFGGIYEVFSHNVYSLFMLGAWVVPLLGGLVTEIFLRLTKRQKAKTKKNLTVQFVAGAVIWLTLGSLFQGVLEIYGTSNQKVMVFLYVGVAQAALAVLMIILTLFRVRIYRK